jgi:hypothetical protein
MLEISSHTKSDPHRLLIASKPLRPLPARSWDSGSPLPSLGEGLGVRARLVGCTNRIWYQTLDSERNSLVKPRLWRIESKFNPLTRVTEEGYSDRLENKL